MKISCTQRYGNLNYGTSKCTCKLGVSHLSQGEIIEELLDEEVFTNSNIFSVQFIFAQCKLNYSYSQKSV